MKIIMKNFRKLAFALVLTLGICATFMVNNNAQAEGNDVTLSNIMALTEAQADTGGVICASTSHSWCFAVCGGGGCDVYYGWRI